MNRGIHTARYEEEFSKEGLIYEYGQDKPGKVYTPHRHGWTKLVTLAGSINIITDGLNCIVQRSGDVCEIQSGQLHEAMVGPDGWNWLAAWKPEENSTFLDHE